MRAVWYERQGPAADVLVVGETDPPNAGAGEVRVKLAASGVNPSDCNRRRGAGYALEYPRVIPNSDGAGVPREWLGRRVWADSRSTTPRAHAAVEAGTKLGTVVVLCQPAAADH